jgi:HAD superfamily hydrolase (TIGR01549 family)
VTALKSAVLFDLDETLVLTSAIEPLRRLRRWSKVYASFGQTTLPPGTVDFVARLRGLKNVGLGVVTKSPRPYAEKLLKFHEIEIPVLVAYHDVGRHKPHPEGLLRAAKSLSVPPSQLHLHR